MRLSARYALPLIALVLAALVPTAVNRHASRNLEDCAHPDLLRLRDAYGNVTTDHELMRLPSKKWWSAGAVPIGHDSGGLLRFAVLRSHRADTLYLRPHTYLLEGLEPENSETLWIEDGDERIPVQVVQDVTARGMRLSVHLFVYRHQVVADPLLAQLRGAFDALLHGTPPMTLFAIAGQLPREQTGRAERRARSWMKQAWSHYKTACLAGGNGAEPRVE